MSDSDVKQQCFEKLDEYVKDIDQQFLMLAGGVNDLCYEMANDYLAHERNYEDTKVRLTDLMQLMMRNFSPLARAFTYIPGVKSSILKMALKNNLMNVIALHTKTVLDGSWFKNTNAFKTRRNATIFNVAFLAAQLSDQQTFEYISKSRILKCNLDDYAQNLRSDCLVYLQNIDEDLWVMASEAANLKYALNMLANRLSAFDNMPLAEDPALQLGCNVISMYDYLNFIKISQALAYDTREKVTGQARTTNPQHAF